jgi:hypothetical protein
MNYASQRDLDLRVVPGRTTASTGSEGLEGQRLGIGRAKRGIEAVFSMRNTRVKTSNGSLLE